MFRDKKVQNAGGCEQYQYVPQDIDIETIDGVLDVYKKIKENKYQAFDEKGNYTYGEKGEKVAKLITSFFDAHVFNTPESREVLGEYLNVATKEEERKRHQANNVVLATIQDRLQH